MRIIYKKRRRLLSHIPTMLSIFWVEKKKIVMLESDVMGSIKPRVLVRVLRSCQLERC
jgi:hypothetical protein